MKNDYLEDVGAAAADEGVDLDAATQLACIEIKRVFRDMNGSALEKRSNLDYLEKEVKKILSYAVKNIFSPVQRNLF